MLCERPNGVASKICFRKWTKVETLMLITDSVRDVAFCPNLGRSYHMLAVASKDVRIVTLKPIGSK